MSGRQGGRASEGGVGFSTQKSAVFAQAEQGAVQAREDGGGQAEGQGRAG